LFGFLDAVYSPNVKNAGASTASALPVDNTIDSVIKITPPPEANNAVPVNGLMIARVTPISKPFFCYVTIHYG